MPKRTWTETQLIEAVASSISLAEILRKLKLRVAGGNYQLIQKHIARLNLSTKHLLGQGYLKGKTHSYAMATPVEKLLAIDSGRQNVKRIKIYLIKNEILPYLCEICKVNKWNNQPLTLQIDHINGNSNDNRLINLRLLCPNCHSQTPTFAGRSLKGRRY